MIMKDDNSSTITHACRSSGWGFGEFKDGKPTGEAVHKTCFACHEQSKERDFIFTRYSP